MQLMSVSVNTRIAKENESQDGFTMFAMYQEKGTDGKWGEPLYNWINSETWVEVMDWLSSNPIGSPIIKQ